MCIDRQLFDDIRVGMSHDQPALVWDCPFVMLVQADWRVVIHFGVEGSLDSPQDR